MFGVSSGKISEWGSHKRWWMVMTGLCGQSMWEFVVFICSVNWRIDIRRWWRLITLF